MEGVSERGYLDVNIIFYVIILKNNVCQLYIIYKSKIKSFYFLNIFYVLLLL